MAELPPPIRHPDPMPPMPEALRHKPLTSELPPRMDPPAPAMPGGLTEMPAPHDDTVDAPDLALAKQLQAAYSDALVARGLLAMPHWNLLTEPEHAGWLAAAAETLPPPVEDV